MRLRAGVKTDKGCVRDLNEDVYAVRPRQGLFVVCDGMGGCSAGEVASQLAVTAILEELNPTRRADAANPGGPGYLPQTSRLADAVRRSNACVYTQAQQDASRADMGTTVVSAWITRDIASVAHVGDSRAYLWHHDRLERLTRDHSLVEAYVQAGLTDGEISLPPDQQNVLVRVLGREPNVDVDVTEVPVQPGDYLLLCSDGLTRMVPDGTIAQIIVQLRRAQQICDALVDAAIRNGGADNVTVVVVQVAESWWQRWSNPWRGQVWRKANGEPHVAAR